MITPTGLGFAAVFQELSLILPLAAAAEMSDIERCDERLFA